MSKERSPEPLDFFIWTVFAHIKLRIFPYTTEQILRFIRRCHMKWGDFITLCKELRRIKGRAEGSSAMVGPFVLLGLLHQGSKAQQTVESRLPQAGALMQKFFPTIIPLL